MRNFLSVTDLSPREIIDVLDRAAALKAGKTSSVLEGKVGVLIFEKPSLRTKLSFDVGISRLGGHPVYFSPEETGIDTREPAEDIARVVSRMGDVAVVRTFAHSSLERFASAATIPVINALTDSEHPCQALADLLTVREACGSFAGEKIAYIGDGNNTAASLALAVALVGGVLQIASPERYRLPDAVVQRAGEISAETGASIAFANSPEEAAAGAAVVYTDVWTSMGQEAESALRREDFAGYQVNDRLLQHAGPDVKFMHDLPAHPGEEIAPGMLDDSRSIVFDQAENRLHAQMGLLDFLFRQG